MIPNHRCVSSSLTSVTMKKIFGYYYATDSGDIYSAHTKKILKKRINCNGYYFVNLSVGGKCKTFVVHRLVCLAYHRKHPRNWCQVNHINGVKTDNNPNNLEWCTAYMNSNHALRTGLRIPARGKLTNNGRFDSSDIRNIRKMEYSNAEAARVYHVTRSAIAQIRSRKTYAWVK